MNNRKLKVWLPLLFSLVLIVGIYIGFKLRENTITARNFFRLEKKSPLQEVLDLINRKYVDKVNTDTIADDAIQEMLKHLDPHSVFIPAVNLQNINADLKGNFEGIGVEFMIIKDTVNITNVLAGGPSEKAGLQIGDKLLEADDSNITGPVMNSDSIRNRLRGPGGSSVKVKMLRGSEILNANITRGRIPIPSIDAAHMIDDSTGFIRLNKFSETTYEEFMQELEKLLAAGMKNLILDLRNNGGGIMGEAVDIADQFLDGNKLIVYTEGDKVKKHEYKALRDGLFEKGKLVLLMDENSASASEVLAGALQDWDRATIVGRRSFGKGLVQEQYQLSDGSALRLTVARYYTPAGRSIQKPYDKGVDFYHEEVSARYHNGEFLNMDSLRFQGKAFKTHGGRTVYGGGGITPDVFVPMDTTGYSRAFADLYLKGTINYFIYHYYVKNKQELSQFRDPKHFVASFNKTDDMFEALKEYAKNDKIDLTSIRQTEKDELTKRLKALLARQIWRTDGFYQVNNLYDPVVLKAMEELRK